MSEIIKLSRSTVEKYLSCPRCCVLDKISDKTTIIPFTLNIAEIYVKMNSIIIENSEA